MTECYEPLEGPVSRATQQSPGSKLAATSPTFQELVYNWTLGLTHQFNLLHTALQPHPQNDTVRKLD